MYKEIINKLKDKKIAILGFGKEGKSTYNFIRKHLKEKEITILDEKEIEIDDLYTVSVSGKDYLDNLDIFDLIIKSPGISLKDIKNESVHSKITSQLELLLEVYRENVIGITGTKGKSTTTSLIYEIIKNERDNVYLLGNIGIPVLEMIDEYDNDSILVIEMSSHQLEYLKVSPHIAIILNLFQDHLDHSGSLEHYHNNKMNIAKYQNSEDYLIYASDNDYLINKINEFDYKAKKYDVRFDNSNIIENSVRINDSKVYIDNELVYEDGKRNLIGNHNLNNIMFALTVVKILGLDYSKAKKIIEDFKGLKYRMEKIGSFQEIDFYNDTIATIPDATINAINAIKNVDTLIFGGMDRGIDYKHFISFLEESDINNLICMPSTGNKIGKILKATTDKNIVFVTTLEEAYEESIKCTKKGYSCLLSPAAASYEYFKNFEEKGAKFEEIVKNKKIG